MKRTSGSKMANSKNWAEQAGMFMNGWGPGPGATLIVDRNRDVAAYERMKAGLPKKPPSQMRPRDPSEVHQTEVAEAAVQAS